MTQMFKNAGIELDENIDKFDKLYLQQRRMLKLVIL